MDVEDRLENINSKEDFIDFLNLLSKNRREKEDEWENKTLEDYLMSLVSWIEDMDIEDYCKKNNLQIPNNKSWSFIAELLYIGKIYE